MFAKTRSIVMEILLFYRSKYTVIIENGGLWQRNGSTITTADCKVDLTFDMLSLSLCTR